MRTLFYYPLHAFSRIVRVMLGEKQLECKLVHESPWNLSEQLLKSNRFGSLPALIDVNGTSVSGIYSIVEYLEESYPEQNLLGRNAMQRMESRQIASWFALDFFHEVYCPILNEKIIKRFKSKAVNTPNPAIIRNASHKIPKYMGHLSYLLTKRSWLAGNEFTIADIFASSFLSVLDYLSTLKWMNYDDSILTWYVRIKSRKSFRGLLADSVPNMPPDPLYAKLDF